MQSALPHVLAVLDRVHEPGRPAQCVRWARAAGFEHVSLDLIYGTPGETDADWRQSLETALAAVPDHISAYALIVEEGTRLAARVRRGGSRPRMTTRWPTATCSPRRCSPRTGSAGTRCPTGPRPAPPGARTTCSTGRAATGGGVGPGAHSHVGGTRWWNVKHPSAYAGRLSAGVSPGHARETLTAPERQLERVMLLTRLAGGCPVGELEPAGQVAAATAVADGLADASALAAGRVVLTLRGRLLADAVIRDLTP